MNYLSGAFRYVAGAESEPQNLVPRLIDRIKTSALPYDRRAAITQLTNAAKASPASQAQVGELGLKVVYAVLEQDVDYDDTVKATLELLIAICGKLDPPSQHQPTNSGKTSPPQDLSKFEHASARAAETNIDVFLGLPNALSLLLQLLEKDDFYVKFGTIELLTAMAANSRNTLQAALLEASQGVSRICDLLDDSHQHVRSNAVLLLSTLCEQSPEICKIVAFGGVFEKLFALIESVLSNNQQVSELSTDQVDEEDSLEAAIVVQDVLLVVRNLVNGAKSTKTLFRDTGCLPRLVSVLQRSSLDSGITSSETGTPIELTSTGVKSAVQKQARKNLILAMTCVASLTSESDEETQLVKSELATSSLFKVLSTLAFVTLPEGIEPASLPKNVLATRIWSLRTISVLVRGHDDFRVSFSDAAYGLSSHGKPLTMQVAALNAVMKDRSASVRYAAFLAVRSSFVVNAGLDLPSSALVNAMTGSAGTGTYSLANNRSTSHNALDSTRGLSSATSSLMHIVDTLKEALVGWPSAVDAAGVFYAASLVSWMVSRVDNAREKLLGCYVHGSALMHQIIRSLGKLERERGPAEIRVSLFSLLCIWLHECPEAVSAFLSSATPLPMLVDVLKASGSRGDIAEVHTKGLAAVILGICFKLTLTDSDINQNGGFLSGGRVASIVHSHAAVADAIRTRIGVTLFTACLDDLKMAKGFTEVSQGGDIWEPVESLLHLEERGVYLSKDGKLGHDSWYTLELANAVNEVYKTVSEKALDLVSTSQTTGPVPAAVFNGHIGTTPSGIGQPSLLADSARDEVLTSYKEFIRAQDENLSAARRQIEELSTALRETQVELDQKMAHSAVSNSKEAVQSIALERDKLLSEKDILETLLQEKTADFSALSDAFAALEEEQASSIMEHSQENGASIVELDELRQQFFGLKESLAKERQRNHELSQRAVSLDEEVRLKEVELLAVATEREHLRSNINPGTAEALQWRRRAEIAEATARSHETMIGKYEGSVAKLHQEIELVRAARDESLATVRSAQQQIQSTKSELESLRATRKRELQVSRQASAVANASTHGEIVELRQQLADAQEKLRNDSAGKAEAAHGFEKLQTDYQALTQSFEQLRTELLDSRQAGLQWQKKCEASESARLIEKADHEKLMSHSQALEGRLKTISSDAARSAQALAAATTKVTELEQQCKDIDGIRRNIEDESVLLKEQLASRTEQSIRLSGQMYELEESNAKLEEQLQKWQDEFADSRGNTQDHEAQIESNEELHSKMRSLEQELEQTKEILADSKDRESLSQAQARDREDAFAKISALESENEEHRTARKELLAEISVLKEGALRTVEAEEAKRSLASQVHALQQALSEASVTTAPSDASAFEEKEKELDNRIKTLQTAADEKELRVRSLEVSLNEAAEKHDILKKEKEDYAKQVAELEAMVSVLQSDRIKLTKENDELLQKVESCMPQESVEITSLSELEKNNQDLSSAIEELNSKLTATEDQLKHSEGVKDGLSSELSSMIQACKLSEDEFSQLKKDKDALSDQLNAAVRELDALAKKQELIIRTHNVESSLNSVLVDASWNAKLTAEENLKFVDEERITAVKSQEQLQGELHSLNSKLREMEEIHELQRQKELTVSEQSAEINRLSNDLEILRKSSADRKLDLEELERVKETLATLTAEKSKALQTIEDLRSENSSLAANLEERISVLTEEGTKVQSVLDEERSANALRENALKLDIGKHLEEEKKLRSELQALSQKETEATSSEPLLGIPTSHQDSASIVESEGASTQEVGISVNEARALQQRISELEDALRDAARTVTGTNRELITAQGLLVELSADKTAMMMELSCAKDSIEVLSKRVTDTPRSPSSHGPPLSEISEQDHLVSEVSTGASSPELPNHVTEQTLRSAHVEADNLRMALRRSMDEAESAAELLISIESRVKIVEGKLQTTRAALSASHESEANLRSEVRVLENKFQKESFRLNSKIEEQNLAASKMEQTMQETMQDLTERLANKTKAWETERSNLSTSLSDANNKANIASTKCHELEEQMQNLELELRNAKSEAAGLSKSNEELTVSLAALKSNEERLQTELGQSHSRENDMKETIARLEVDKTELTKTYEEARKESIEKHSADVNELEVEIDRINNVMEDTERQFRNKEGSLRLKLNQQSLEISERESDLSEAKKIISNTTEDLKRLKHAKQESEMKLSEELRQKSLDLEELKRTNEVLSTNLETVKSERRSVREKLMETIHELNSLKQDFEMEKSEKLMLLSENQDFLSTVESLEGESKQIRSTLKQTSGKLLETENKLRETESRLFSSDENVVNLKATVDKNQSTIEKLNEKIEVLGVKTTELNRNLAATQLERDNYEEDNRDLRTWVADLERQAIELQTAASDFEEVERTLREALDSNRQANEANGKLREDLRKEKEALSTSENRLGQALRDKEAAESSRESSQRRAEELEARLREIREENLAKFNRSEEAIAAKAKQCAELETALAVSQRMVAELESKSDELFGAKTALTQRDEDIRNIKARAIRAEKQVEDLSQELRNAEEEILEAREASSGDGYRALLAEHNELLVYLADLELEVTTQREELGRE